MSEILSISKEDLNDLDDIESITLEAKNLIRKSREVNQDALNLKASIRYCEQSENVRAMDDDALALFLNLPVIED